MMSKEIVEILEGVEEYVLNHPEMGTLIYKYIPRKNLHYVVTDLPPEKVADLTHAELHRHNSPAFLNYSQTHYYLTFCDMSGFTNVTIYKLQKEW